MGHEPEQPISEQIAVAADSIRAGSVVAFPTETYYGLGADPRCPEALRQALCLKGREGTYKPLLLLAASLDHIAPWVSDFPADFDRLAARFWPGPLTLVLPAASAVPVALLGPSGGVAVRISSHPIACRLIRACGAAITGTSANRSGEPPAADAGAVRAVFGRELAAIVDGGPAPGEPPSTLVDLCGEAPRLLREGAVGSAALRDVVRLL